METGPDLETYMEMAMESLRTLNPSLFALFIAREASTAIVGRAAAELAEKPKKARGRPRKARADADSLLGPLSDPTRREPIAVDTPLDVPIETKVIGGREWKHKEIVVEAPVRPETVMAETVALATDGDEEQDEETEPDAEVSLRKPKTARELAPSKDLPPPVPEVVGLELYQDDPSLRRHLPDLLPAWKAAYPAVDVKREIAAAHAWEVANVDRRKTSRGRSRFLNRWLERCQNNGGEYRGRRSAPQKTRKQAEEAM